jgi:hypothetical protein
VVVAGLVVLGGVEAVVAVAEVLGGLGLVVVGGVVVVVVVVRCGVLVVVVVCGRVDVVGLRGAGLLMVVVGRCWVANVPELVEQAAQDPSTAPSVSATPRRVRVR